MEMEMEMEMESKEGQQGLPKLDVLAGSLG